MSLSDVLGGFGPGTKVNALGKEWTFVFDVPAMAAAMEEMCLQWHREAYEADLSELRDRNIPGSFDSRMAEKLFDEFRAEKNGGACKIAHQGNPGGGSVYRKWAATNEGKISGLLAALKIKHPDATIQTLTDITNAVPDQIRMIVNELGNALRGAVPKLAASLQTSHPEVSEYLTAKAAELETTLNGSPA